MAISKWKKALAAGAVLLAIAGPAVAGDSDNTNNTNNWQPRWGVGPMMGGWGGGGWGGGPMMGYDGSEAFLDHVDGRLAFLKAELKITEAQTPAWDDLAKAVHTAADSQNALMQGTMKMFRDGDFEKMSLPDRLNFRRTHLEARLQEVNDVGTALDKLYGQLSDDQKQVADNIVLPMMGMGMGSGFGRGFGPWGGGGFGPGRGPGMMRQ